MSGRGHWDAFRLEAWPAIRATIHRGSLVNFSLFLSGRRAFQMFALWLGLAALMVQGLAPLCAGGMGGSQGPIASVVICTTHGFQTVQVDGNGQPLSHQNGASMSDCCSACHAPGGFMLASPLPLAKPERIAYVGRHFASAPVVAARLYASYGTRGPPAAMSHPLA
jgi:hypothetical protein